MKSIIKDNTGNEVAKVLKNATALTPAQTTALINILMLNSDFAEQMSSINTDDFAKFRKQLHDVLAAAQIAELSYDELEFMRHPKNFDRNEQFIADRYIEYSLAQITDVQYQYVDTNQNQVSTFAGYKHQVAEFKKSPYVNELYVTIYKWDEIPTLSVRDIGIDYTLNGRKGYTKFNVPDFAAEIADDLQQLFEKNWPKLQIYATDVVKKVSKAAAKDLDKEITQDEARIPMEKIVPLLETAEKNAEARAAKSPLVPIYYSNAD